jgi:hypothetical protein
VFFNTVGLGAILAEKGFKIIIKRHKKFAKVVEIG